MAIINPPVFNGSAANSYTASRVRRLVQTLLADREGVLGEADFLCSADSPASLRVRVQPGRAYLMGESRERQGAYLIENDAVMTSAYTSPADPFNPRIDLVLLRNRDAAADGDGTAEDAADIYILPGTAAASPSPPAVPAGTIPLAEVTVPAASAVITTITDRRPRAHYLGGGDGLLGNGEMALWSRGTAAAPDGWVLSGTGAAVARDTTTVESGAVYSAALTNGASQTASLVQRLAGAADTANPTMMALRNQVITVSARVWANVTGRVRLVAYNGQTSFASSYHTGSGTWETLHVSFPIANTFAAGPHVDLVIDLGAATTARFGKVNAWLGDRQTAFLTGMIVHPPRPAALSELTSGRVYERGSHALHAYSSASATVYTPLQFQTRKATAPTVTISSPAYTNGSGAAALNPTTDGYSFGGTVTALGAAVISGNADAVV